MKIRDVVLDQSHSFTQAALTWTHPINIVDPVTEFKVLFQAQTHPDKGAAPDYPWPGPMPYLIEEIAVIDGSEVIFALNGAEMFALSCFDLGFAPYHAHQEHWDRPARWAFPIHFGRSLVDPEWIFDPKKFRNPQIRITWDLEAVQAIGAGTYADPTVTPIVITIWAKVMEEGARPRGYLMTKQIKEYTPAAAGTEITWLPVDFPIRKLLVRSYLFGGFQTHGTSHLKLSQDQDKWIPFDLEGGDFARLMKNWFTEVQLHGYHYVSEDEEREHLSGAPSSGLVVAAQGSYFLSPTNWVPNTFYSEVRDFNGAEPNEAARIEAWSQSMTRTPLDCFCYPFGDQENAADWLQTAPMGNLRLLLTHAEETWEELGGFPIVQIVTQQAHPY